MLMPTGSIISQMERNPDNYGGYQDFWHSIGNFFTGNTDFARQELLADKANAFTAAQAQIARDYNSMEAQKARDFEAQQAQINRDFQERMSNSAYSRAFADMRANGINPYLSLSPASTPSGASASGFSASSSLPSGARGSVSSPAGVGVIINSAFNLARTAIMAGVSANNANYTDMFANKHGEVTGWHTHHTGK